ncbi:MAG TPA: hypothetical protein VHG89_10150 [Verrucomicrobiae bacterium]|nr:hypothetical protein [Verrucomicrobiae bacterium]
MKKFTIVGLLGVIIIVCLLLYWQHDKASEFDRDFRQNLTGTWLREEDNLPHGVGMPQNMRCTNIVAPDGSFVELSWFSHPDRTNTYRQTGTWIVKNRHLIETVKTSTNPSEVTPHIGTGRIISADARGFTLRWQNSNESVWKKIIQ